MNVRLDLILDSPVSPDSCRELGGSVQKEHALARLAPAAVRTWVVCFVYGFLVLRAEVIVTDGGMAACVSHILGYSFFQDIYNFRCTI
jgi:hypothetical protein